MSVVQQARESAHPVLESLHVLGQFELNRPDLFTVSIDCTVDVLHLTTLASDLCPSFVANGC